MSPPNMIESCNIVWELWLVQDFNLRGNKNIMNKVRVVCLARDMPTSPYLCLCQILSNCFQYLRINGVHKMLAEKLVQWRCQNKARVALFACNAPTLRAMFLLDLIYVPTKY